MRNVPTWIVRSHLPQITVVTYVVAYPIFVHIHVLLSLASKSLRDLERFQNRTTVRFPSSQIVDFGASRCFNECRHELGDVLSVNIVPNLFASIAENAILTTLEIAFDEIAQKAVQLYAGMVWTR